MFKKPVGMKKALGLLLTASALTLAACGANGTGSTNNEPVLDAEGNEVAFGRVGAMENFSVGDQFYATSPIELTMLFRELAEAPFSNDWMMLDRLAERTNVSFSEVQPVLHDDFATQRQLLISTGNAPELMPFIYGQDVAQFVAGGSLLALDDYFQYMPHFTHFMDTWNLWDEFNINLRQADGRHYMLPGIQEDTRVRFTVIMRQDILDDLGLDVPDNWDEIHEVLREVEAAFPGSFPYQEAWGGDATLNIAARTFGVRFGWGLGNGLVLDHTTNTHTHISQMPEMRDFIEYWATLVEEDLLLPESMAGGFDEAWERFTNGYSFMVGTNGAPMHTSFTNDMAELAAEGFTGGPFGIEGAQLVTLPIPNGPTGMVGEARLNNGMVLNRSIAEREDFIAILQFIDWLWYSEEGREFSLWGIEGETFEWVTEEGETFRRLLPGFYNPSWPSEIGNALMAEDGWQQMNRDLGFGETVWLPTQGGSRDLLTSTLDSENTAIHLANTERVPHLPNPNPPFTELEQEAAGSIASQITDATNAFAREIIVGNRDISEWDAFAESVADQAARLAEMADEAHARERLN